ncbi:unnamed protein product [Mycena citricolor]|uniref:Uncharacterized protein n=1 Tax=Mycena citricolor TaxID=2018698 RepID=A0AAD2H1D8_9AGAR|nr:unnamed protein product [Mycena citricolor]
MRPSAAQLLQHERIEFAHKVSETEKLLNTIKTHRSNLTAKERDLCTRESALKEQEAHIAEAIQQRDGQIHLLQTQLHECHMDMNSRPNISDVNMAVKQREEELRVLVLKREEEVSQSMQRREDEIMEAIRRREAEVLDAWSKREEVLREEFRLALAQELEARSGMFEERESDLLRREAAMKEDEERVDSAKRLLEEKVKVLDEQMANLSASKKDRSPLDEVQNILSRAAQQVTPKVSAASKPSMKNQTPCPVTVTPLQRSSTHKLKELFQPSAMKGVVLTNTGEVLTTPSPAELAKMFDLSRRFEDEVMASPKVGLNFAQVFDGDKKDAGRGLVQKLRETALESESEAEDEERETIRRTTQVRRRRESGADVNGEGSAPPTRLRRPSIRTSGRRSLVPSTVSDSEIATTSTSTTQSKPKARPLPHPHLAATGSTAFPTRSNTAPTYDMDDDENLPSPFLKRTERVAAAAGSAAASVGAGAARKSLTKRPSGGNFLRVVAAVNSSATKRGTSVVRA